MIQQLTWQAVVNNGLNVLQVLLLTYLSVRVRNGTKQ